MKRYFLLIIAITGFQIVSAQYTEIINSKRPGFSESPYSIGTNVYQVEADFFYRSSNNPSILGRPSSYGSDIFLRYGKFDEKLELNLNLTYQIDEVKSPFDKNYFIHGISDLTIGAKYLVYQQEFADRSKEIRSWKKRTAFDFKRLIPSVGVYGGVHTNFFVNELFLHKDAFIDSNIFEDGMSYKGALLLQNDFNDRLVLLTNLIADRIGSENDYYSYIVTLTYAVNQNWSFFIENHGKFKTDYSPEQQFGTGLAYLISPNLQVDAAARTNFFDNYSFVYASAGISWRLDKHQDAIIFKNTPIKKNSTKNKKGFFKRLFSKKRN
ncbi:transporter [Lutibacter maritimus]|uniref:Putative MetA-pathway of phenol degradation n=1 Tax=Lutibacter maritimus TaxID=593133 RepID=A0A1I6SCT0_9FLAO|nr:transporter [Lutibacter maritimus]SFS74640.1 Putative MetA-pathway of phenol degradation [Lutibacter maritimus]